MIYSDDGLIIGKNYSECERVTKIIIEDITTTVFVLNKDKCKLIPMQVGTWLGTEIDTRQGSKT